MSDGVGVGYGARPHADGNDAIYLVAQENYPVEFMDSVLPGARAFAMRSIRDTGGPGRWRGGCGMVREVEVLAEEGDGFVAHRSRRVSALGRRRRAMRAARAAASSIPAGPTSACSAPLSDGNIVQRGDVVRIETGGGGGWGHPFDREPERVLDDVRERFRQPRQRRGGLRRRADAGRPRGRRGGDAARAAPSAPRPKLFHRHGYQRVA